MHTQTDVITLKLDKSALAGQLAGTYRALGYLEEGGRFARLAQAEREGALSLIGERRESPDIDDTTFPFPSVEELSFCCSYNEEPDSGEAPREGEPEPPTPSLADLSEGDTIRVFKEGYAGGRTSEKGVVFRHDGSYEGAMPWCRDYSHESEDFLTPYLNSSDIIKWEAA